VAEDDRVPALAEERERASERVGGGDAGFGVDPFTLALSEPLLFS
jgi:hypothetical protein